MGVSRARGRVRSEGTRDGASWLVQGQGPWGDACHAGIQERRLGGLSRPSGKGSGTAASCHSDGRTEPAGGSVRDRTQQLEVTANVVAGDVLQRFVRLILVERTVVVVMVTRRLPVQRAVLQIGWRSAGRVRARHCHRLAKQGNQRDEKDKKPAHGRES